MSNKVEKTCPMCRGRKVTGRLTFGEEPTELAFGRRRLRVLATIIDGPCRTCRGTGQVPDEPHGLPERPAGMPCSPE